MFSVNDLMSVTPVTVAPDTPVAEIYRLMVEEAIRHLPVVEEGVLVGIVTERDVREVLNTPLFDIVSAETIMTENPITVTPETPAYIAAEMLNTYKFGALPVVDGRRLVGIVTVSDFLDHFSNSDVKFA